MQNNCNDSETEDKLLNNSLLFSSIRKNKTTDEKIQKVKKYLDRGADINATDANNKNNTPLHVAVMKGELEVVRFLLERGALANIKNSNNETALDIARLSDKSAGKIQNIVNVLEAFNNDKLKRSCRQQELDTNLPKKSDLKSLKEREDPKYIQPVTCDTENQTQSSDVNNGSAVKNIKLKQKKPNQQQLNKQLKTACETKTFCYQKRTGTSSLSGQLYKTKLLCLILFRALYVYKDKTFLIATNIEKMDAFDDIVFRFYSNTGNKPKILFVQAKHKDNPEKDKFTVEEIMKSNGDFSLHKYLESYIKIIQIFDSEKNDDNIFRGEFKDMDCEFIIYTTAFEKFSKKKFVEQNESASFIYTSEAKRDLEDNYGHPIRTKIPYVFQFDYDDQNVDVLVQTVAKSRAVLLAKQFSKIIFKDNHENMMMDDLIKTYHAFLARHILEVEMKEGESQNHFRYAKFRKSFFSSHDHLLLAFKSTICKIVSPEKPDQLESILMSQKFKVPLNFGNLNFCFSGNKETQENELYYLCSKFKQIFAKAAETLSENILMKVDDNMVGPNKILQSADLESHRLGGLVGNLLVFDNVTKTLKFNFDVDTLSDDNLKLLENLKSDVFIGIANKCRFDINIQHFPRLSLVHEENDKKLIKKFLCNLIFYTNQAKEDEVEKILKKEIDIYFVGGRERQSIVKSDAIFLKIHDRVQKWWQQPFSASYLTESCKYFREAEQDILNSPLLSILNFTFTETIKNALPEIKFKNTALELLQLDGFFEGPEKILSLITEENALSSVKLIQYFEERNFNGYTFIDLDYVGIRNYFVDVKAEIKESKLATLIVVCKGKDVADINLLIRHFARKIIVISNRNLSNQIKRLVTEDIVERVDNQIGFKDLADTMRTMLLEDRYIVFQGKEIPLGILFEDESYYLINSQLLNMIINNKKITIGNFLNSPAYDEISDVYINEELCRYITLDPSVKTKDQYSVVKYNELGDDFRPDTKDIVLVADNREEFCEFINTYGNCNVHWFHLINSYKYRKDLVWQESRGKLLNILNHVNRGTHSANTLQPVTLTDVSEKVVIISAEPGMGKSSLLTHLAINTKDKYPALWISKINLLEYTDVLRRIKESQTTIDLKEAMQFLFRVIGFKASKDRKAEFEIIIDLVSVTGDDIVLKNKVELNVTGSNLFEIELFIYCYNNNRVVLLLDGFDEICPDFANELIQLVKIFKKSKVIHLWITSRLYNVLHQLENGLETFSFTIQPVSPENQLEFIKKMFLRKFGSSKCFPTIKGEPDCVGHFRQLLGLVVEKNFLTIPLHLYMTSELFQDSYFINSFDPEYVNLSKIYELLVESKFFKIRFGEKKPLLCINDPDMRKLVDTERTAFLYAHKVMAAHVIFGETDEIQLFDTNDMNTLRDFIEEIKVGEEKTGIVERIIQDKPQFVHYTFAEYFAAEFLCDKLKSFQCRSSIWLYLINSFLQSERDGPLRFLDHKLENLQLMFDETYIADLHEMFESLLLERDNLEKTLYSLIYGRLYNIAIILLKFVKAVLGRKNLKFFIDMVTDVHKSFYMYNCIVCMTVQRQAKQVLTFIINLINDIDDKRIIDIFDCSDFPRFSPLTDGGELRDNLCRNVELLDALLSTLSPSVLVDLLCQTITYNLPCDKEVSIKMIHVFIKSWLKGDIDTEWFNQTLEKLNREQLMTIFRARDWQNRVAAHRVAMEQSYSIFYILESLLDRNQFKEICMTRDKAELTPLHYFNTKINGEQLRFFLEKVYNGNPKENFVSRHDLMEEKFKKYVQSLVIFGGTDEIQLFHAYDTNDITEIRDFIEDIKVKEEKTCLVEEIIQNKSKFDLYTFAKYIAAEFLCDELNSFRCRTSLWVYLINTYFQSEVDEPRRFFYAKLENHQLMFNEIYNADLNKKFENLLSERQKLTQSLYKAIDSKLYNIAIILLKFVKDVLTKKNINDFMDVLNNSCTDRCIVCIAVRNNAKDVVNFIIELIRSIDDNRIIDIFKCFDLPISNPLVVRGGLRKSLRQNVELLDALLSDLTPSELVDLFCRDVGNYYTNTSSKIIHIFIKSWLQGFIDTEWFDRTLEKFNREQLFTIFTSSDSGKKVAAHIAALEQSYTFFDKLESLLDKNQFKEICKTPDIEGKTPMHNFSDTNCEKLKILLDKVYDGNAKEIFVSRLDLLDKNFQQRTKQKNSDTQN